jgi:hypothetical protein
MPKRAAIYVRVSTYKQNPAGFVIEKFEIPKIVAVTHLSSAKSVRRSAPAALAL